MKSQVNYCRKYGYVVTPFGRRVYLSSINDKNNIKKSFAERQAINAPLQGGSADIIKLAMIALFDNEDTIAQNFKLLLQVHDELIFEVLESKVEESKIKIKKAMEKVVNLKVPLLVDIGVGDNWSEAH